MVEHACSKMKYYVSQKQNGFNNKIYWYSILVTFIFKLTARLLWNKIYVLSNLSNCGFTTGQNSKSGIDPFVDGQSAISLGGPGRSCPVVVDTDSLTAENKHEHHSSSCNRIPIMVDHGLRRKRRTLLRPLPFNHSGNRDLFFRKNNFGIDASI